MAPLKVRVDGKGNPIVVVPPALRPPPEVLIESRLTWSYEDLALMTGLSVPTLRNLVSHHGFPHIRIGHRVLFTPESVRDWFAAQIVRLPPGTEEPGNEEATGEMDD